MQEKTGSMMASIFVVILTFGLVSPITLGAEIFAISKDMQSAAITNDLDHPWMLGEQACASTSNNEQPICGTVTKVAKKTDRSFKRPDRRTGV